MIKPNAVEREIARERIRYWSDHFLTTAINDDEIGALEEIFEKALADRREACARKADGYAAQNHRASVEAHKRFVKLGNDPFGHGDMAAGAADELASCANEAEALAAAIRSMED